jgi:hypothetical protein
MIRVPSLGADESKAKDSVDPHARRRSRLPMKHFEFVGLTKPSCLGQNGHAHVFQLVAPAPNDIVSKSIVKDAENTAMRAYAAIVTAEVLTEKP